LTLCWSFPPYLSAAVHVLQVYLRYRAGTFEEMVGTFCENRVASRT
jgi:hypothetical protein